MRLVLSTSATLSPMAAVSASHEKTVTIRSKRAGRRTRSGFIGRQVTVAAVDSTGKRLVLLSGGIGAGKSEVGRRLAAMGAEVIDADRVGHEVLEPGGEAHSAVTDRWPEVVEDGRVDRAALGRIVFADPEELRALEAISHPAIAARIAARVAASERPVVVVELPLTVDLFGAGWDRVVVDAPDDVRRWRLVARGMAPADIDARIAAQPDRAEWRDAADYVVDNAAGLDALAGEVEALWEWLTAPPEAASGR